MNELHFFISCTSALQVSYNLVSVLGQNETLIGNILYGAEWKYPDPPANEFSLRGKGIPKFFMPRYMYRKKSYPPYMTGAAYVMSTNAASCILKECIDILYFKFKLLVIILANLVDFPHYI